ncbi:MAG: glycosyltransferase family 4 protein [Candidatus Zhuqueibacterota bacterium]
MKNTLKKILIVCDSFGFPHGRASAGRVKNIAYGLHQNGVDVHILITVPSERKRSVLNIHHCGSGQDFSYNYSFNNTILSDSKIKRMFQKCYGLLMSCYFLINNKETLDFVIFYARKTQTLFLLGLICRSLKIKTAVELCEWPESFIRKSKFQTYIKKIYSINVFKWVDSAIVISTFLAKKVQEYESQSGRSCPSFLLPILVRKSEFVNGMKTSANGNSIVFCGNLDYIELIEFLFDSIQVLIDSDIDFKLVIIGSADIPGNLEKLKSKATEKNLEKYVYFTGYISKRELLNYYREASVLAIPLPSGIRSEARFPTKIGEYLISGRPIVTTKVGDIPKYMKNLETCFMVEPDSPYLYGEALRMALNDKPFAEKIAERGKQVAVGYFDPIIECKKLLHFLNDQHIIN